MSYTLKDLEQIVSKRDSGTPLTHEESQKLEELLQLADSEKLLKNFIATVAEPSESDIISVFFSPT